MFGEVGGAVGCVEGSKFMSFASVLKRVWSF